MSRGARIALLVGLAALAVVLFFLLRGGDGSSGGGTGAPDKPVTANPQPRTETFELSNGAVVGGPRTITYRVDDVVRLKVVTGGDAQEIHVHGYDEEVSAVGKAKVTLQFVADIDGAFEIEAHTATGDVELGKLEVRPG